MVKFLNHVGSKFICKVPRSPLINIFRNSLARPCHKLETSTRSTEEDTRVTILRLAVDPSLATKPRNEVAVQSSTLAGDPKSIETYQEIQADVLARWNERPQFDSYKEWIRNSIYY